MKPKQLQAHGGDTYKIRMDPQTIFVMQHISEEIGRQLHIRPSQPVLIRRALRHYGAYVAEELSQAKSVRVLEAEKDLLFEAAGRERRQ